MWLHTYGNEGGGNFSGVCHGKDQAVSFKIKALIPELSCIFWVLKMGALKTPEYVLNCQGNLGRNRNCQQGKPTK